MASGEVKKFGLRALVPVVFLVVGAFKLVKIAPGGAWSRVTNLFVSLMATGGVDLERFADLKELLETSTVIVLAVAYYRVWLWLKPYLAKLMEKGKEQFEQKKAEG